MPNSHASRSKKNGLPPGSIVYTGENPDHEVSMTVIYYNEEVFKKEVYHSIDDFDFNRDFVGNTWINIDGISDVDYIKKIGQHFHIDNLTLEDLVNPEQRVKLEEREEYLFLILKMLDRKSTRLNSSHANTSYAVFCLKKKTPHQHRYL